MIRSKQIKQVDLILCADMHLREDTPICRTDDFQLAQWKKVDFISDLQQEYNCPVIHSGDLFHHWKPSPFLLSETIKHLPKDFYTVYGNHDLPQHNLELQTKCGIFTLHIANSLRLLPQGHWGTVPTNGNWTINNLDIFVWHIFTYQGKEPWPGCTSPTANQLLKKYPGYSLIVTGDNHQTFTSNYQGRLLVNSGSMMRQTAGQIDHRPCVFLWHSEDNTVTKVELPFEEDVISREHLSKAVEKDNRIEAFVSKLNGDWKADMSFEENLEVFYQTNKTKEEVIEIINKAI